MNRKVISHKQFKGKSTDVMFLYFQIGQILEELGLENIYLAKVRDSLRDMLFVEQSIKDIRDQYSTHLGSSKVGGTIERRDDLDLAFDFYVRHFYVSGGIIKDTLANFSDEFGFKIKSFLKSEDLKPKKSLKSYTNLVNAFSDRGKAKRLTTFIAQERGDWLDRFTKVRNDIEHREFSLKSIAFDTSGQRVMPIFPLVEGFEQKRLFAIYTINFFRFVRHVVMIFLEDLAISNVSKDGKARGGIFLEKDEQIPSGDLNIEKHVYRYKNISI